MIRIRHSGFLGVRIALAAITAAACSTPDLPNEGEVDQDVVVTNCNMPVPSVPINFDRELVIRSLYVVEDGVALDGNDEANDNCRTSWRACDTSKRGHWTFGYMMAAMAGTNDPNSTAARVFVRDWLKKWLSPQQPNLNKTAAAPRPAITEVLIQPWLTASGCPATATLDSCLLDLQKAPFRLLAFVNRVDLPKVTGYSNGGEFRVVFGAIGYDPVNCPGCAPTQKLNATVILEYGLPNNKTLKQWATDLHELSSYNPDDLSHTLTYRSKLQAITDKIVGFNASPFGPLNRSAIAHVRTNEITFDCQMGTTCNGTTPNRAAAVWEMRQFKLSGPFGTVGAPLVQDTVSQTPQSSDNHASTINNVLINNHAAVYRGEAAFKTTDSALFGNLSTSPSALNAILWETDVLNTTNAPDLTTPTSEVALALTRHQFAFGTCNGCHYAETANQNGLFHIYPRDEGTPSSVSSFLSAGYATNPVAAKLGDTQQLAPLNKFTFTDLAPSGIQFSYNEPWRRACEIRGILGDSITPITTMSGQSHVTSPPICHSICSVGPVQDTVCDSCAAQICAVDSFCCKSSWDSICVGEVASVCNQTCR